MTVVQRADKRAHTVVFLAPMMGVGGAERQFYLLMRALLGTRWTPLLVTLNGRGRFFDEAKSSGIESIYLEIPSLDLFRGARAVRALMRRPDVDVVLARGFSATTLARLAKIGLRNAPAVVVAEHSTGRSASRRWRHDVIDRLLAPVASAFVAVAHSQVPYLIGDKALPSSRIRVIHNGIEYDPYLNSNRKVARAELGFGSDEFVVGIVAALRPEKDHLTFMRAAAGLTEIGEEARFIIVGDGPTRAALEVEAKRLGLLEADRLRFLGSRDDVENLYAAMDVFSLSSNTVETLPMSVLEAMGSSVAVVATHVGGLPELVVEGQTGLLVSPGDPGALARAWDSLRRDRQLCTAMGAAGRIRAQEEFSSAAMGSAYAELFDDLTG